MFYLIVTTVLWAFSFSLIGEYLMDLDKYFLVFIRIVFASALFVPLTKFKGVPRALQLRLMLIGSVQIGVMNMFLYHSYRFLTVPEILLFTIFTPFYVTLAYDLLVRRFHVWYLISAGLAVLGALIIRYDNVSDNFWAGFLLVQAANLCFALGQSIYKYVMESRENIAQAEIFGYFHFGALIVTAFAFLKFGDFERIYPSLWQWSILLLLGLAASGVGYFLWNKGATMVDAGVLSIMNNALIPAGIIVNITLWNRVENKITLTLGTAVILASLLFHARCSNKFPQTLKGTLK
jgi:carboxylate/amino acid/amine transporter